MLAHPTLEKLHHLRLRGMAKAFQEQMKQPEADSLPFTDRLALLIDREVTELLRACRGEVPTPHLRPGHHVIVTLSKVDGAQMPTSVAVPEGFEVVNVAGGVFDPRGNTVTLFAANPMALPPGASPPIVQARWLEGSGA